MRFWSTLGLLICSLAASGCSVQGYEEKLCDPEVKEASLGALVGMESDWAGELANGEQGDEAVAYLLSIDASGVPRALREPSSDWGPDLRSAPSFGCADPIEFPLYEGGVNSVKTPSATAGPSWTNHARAIVSTDEYLRVEYSGRNAIQLLELQLLSDDRIEVRWFSGELDLPDHFVYLYGELTRI